MEAHLIWPLPNVWLGISCEDQTTADARIPLLLKTPAAIRFISLEPQLGPVDIAAYLDTLCNQCGEYAGRDVNERGEDGFTCSYCGADFDVADITPPLDWVIQGAESGPGSRPFDIQWARNTMAQCKDAGVAYFLKQVGSDPQCKNTDYAEWRNMGASMRSGSVGTAATWRIALKDRKGSDVSEWPLDLRVRQFPEGKVTK